MMGQQRQKRVVFIHPDLGIGGAERLIIDAAVGLQSLGSKVTIFTSHCDHTHCFPEARDGTLDVRVRGNSLFPTSIGGRFFIFCAILRQLHLLLSIAVLTNELSTLRPTHFVVDQLSACVPLLRFLSDARILFYCHFPDKLLSVKATGLLGVIKSIYRIPFNWLESWSTSCADRIVVNSKFTAGMVKSALSGLKHRDLEVLYPCVDTSERITKKETPELRLQDRVVILSINRFERKKGIDLAIRAFSKAAGFGNLSSLLVIAGGYDNRVIENIEYLKELQSLADEFGLAYETFSTRQELLALKSSTKVVFLPSISNDVKSDLLACAAMLIYTPRNEHFGIVPIEAMLHKVPVLAATEGGPTETVIDGITGWLRDVKDTASWTKVMSDVIQQSQEEPIKLLEMGIQGHERVKVIFSKEKMSLKLDQILEDLTLTSRSPMLITLTSIFLLIMTVFIIILSMMKWLLYS